MAAILKGVNCFLVARYIILALFTICNAITCSVAIWSSSLTHVTQPLQIDIYLIFLGALSIVSIITLIFVELLCINTVTTRVWFECTWVALFWIMELAGGAALIAIESDIPCSLKDAQCTSARVLLAFTWMCTIILLIYLLVLVSIITSRQYEAPKIWTSDIRALRAEALGQCSLNTPNSPLNTRYKKRANVDVYIPQPVRSQADPPFRHHTGLSAEYEIEPFRPAFVASEQMDITDLSNLPEAIPLPLSAAASTILSFVKPIPVLPKDTTNVHSLSPNRFNIPQELASPIIYSSVAGLPSIPVQICNNSTLPPSPLGDWPRRDIMQLPSKPKPKSKSKPPLPSAFPTTTDGAPVSVPADTFTQPRPRRPLGPRLRVPSLEDNRHRPAPLNLSGISNYKIGSRS